MQTQSRSPVITPINRITAGGFQFTNFDGPNSVATEMNGISNSGQSVGFSSEPDFNFTGYPPRTPKIRILNLPGPSTTGGTPYVSAISYGVNSAGTVVGTYNNGSAFILLRGKVETFIPYSASQADAFGINDKDTVVGDYLIDYPPIWSTRRGGFHC